MSPFALNPTSFGKVVTVVDESLVNLTTSFAVHANASDATVFVSGKDIVTYLTSLENNETKVQLIDFVALKEGSGTPAPAQATPSKTAALDKDKKEDAKIEGAVQIAIGVKKEVDFAGWYTNVLIKADMIDYYSVSGCYILKPWSYSIWEQVQCKLLKLYVVCY